MTNDANPFSDGSTIIRCYGGAKPADKHLASTIHCIDDEVLDWLQRREQRRRDRHVLVAARDAASS
jgi:hypothetical protein